MQQVFIANFGRQNYEWQRCLKNNTIATMNSHATHHFWVAGDREGFIDYELKFGSTAAGIKPTRPVASRWFNLMTIISESENDIWIHREKEQLWWTRSKSEPPVISESVDPTYDGGRPVFACHKKCDPWSNQTRLGNRLEWGTLHPRAKEFLFTEGTLQKLGQDNAEYALALIAGDDLNPWHLRPHWQTTLKNAKTKPGTVFNAFQRAATRMAMTAFDTAKQSSGQQVTRTIKNKEVHFTLQELENYVMALLESQERLCALTDLPLQLDGEHTDSEMLPSLDRIDSDGHYEEGNLQVVCRFVNRWKSDDKDENFSRLIAIVRGE
ncbi:hypothetical protein [Hoeflea poritis]|uniref:Uncharacterized protein n=1 Tax=Hoeflea poritis TaxID=2993659 RepID=A0ABT4VPV3_9HYPH|nr:hypothetical protein [Hoeflea poritis]MDA4846734.1 hypothetical protein [Hoeflea poritis]